MEIIGCHDHPSRQSIAMVDGQAETRHHVSKSTTDGQTGAAARERWLADLRRGTHGSGTRRELGCGFGWLRRFKP